MPPRRPAEPAGRSYNIDEARRARNEKAETPPPFITIGGKNYNMPRSMPVMLLVGLAQLERIEKDADGNIDLAALDGFDDIFSGLFGDNVTEVLRAGLEIEDLEGILGLYDDAEKAPASPASS